MIDKNNEATFAENACFLLRFIFSASMEKNMYAHKTRVFGKSRFTHYSTQFYPSLPRNAHLVERRVCN